MNNQIHQGIGTSAYGKYNIEVVKSGGNESYFPFGTGYQDNVVLDEFFVKIFTGYLPTVQVYLQTCITNTGSNPATRFDTTGTFGVPNDVTWASNFYGRYVLPDEGKIVLTRDFTFDQVAGSAKTYREAMVGFFYTDRANLAEVRSIGDIAVSHFVFPEDVVVNIGERLRINYIFNIVLDYFKTNNRPQIELTGNGYNFGGTLGLMSNQNGLLGVITTSEIYFTAFPQGGNTNLANTLYKSISSNVNSYTIGGMVGASHWKTVHLYGPNTKYRPCFYGSGGSFVPQAYPTKYPSLSSDTVNKAWAADSFAVPLTGAMVVNDAGGYIDTEYFFSPYSTNRNVSGILLSRLAEDGTVDGTYITSIIYLQFNTGQFIPATMPLSMKLRWFWQR